MKRLIALVVMVFGFSFVAFAQNEPKTNSLHIDGEVESEFSDGTATPQFKANITYGGESKLGLYCWVQVKQSWQQFYCGPTFQATDWMQVGAGVGLQTGDERFQAGAFVWVGHLIGSKFVWNLFLIEKSGLWMRNVTGIDVTKQLSLQLAYQRYRGFGPRAEFKINEHFTVGAELNIRNSDPTLVVGLKFRF